MFKDELQQARYNDIGDFATILSAVAKGSRQGAAVTVIPCVSWVEPPTTDREGKKGLHTTLIVVVHSTGLGKGKLLLVCDPNVQTHSFSHTTCMTELILCSHIVELLKMLNKTKYRSVRYFVNAPRAGANPEGACLRLALEWMLEILAWGLTVQREGGIPIQVDGFNEVHRLGDHGTSLTRRRWSPPPLEPRTQPTRGCKARKDA
jgi:hypothetical protein